MTPDSALSLDQVATELVTGDLGLQVEAIYLSRHLDEFIRAAWHIVEPTTKLQWGRHLDALCLHLERIGADNLHNLAVTIPPGTTKSITISVMYPAWKWTHAPSMRFLTASNEDSLAIRDAVASRRLIESEWYRERWGHVFTLTTDQNVKGWYENSRRGFRTTTTVGSSVTGKKGDCLLVDDPHDAQRVESEVERNRVLSWWSKAFYNRVNDPKTGCRIVVGQRTHVGDLLGHVVADGFEHLNLPEEFEPAERSKTVIWQDWRTEAGELLRPERFGPEQIAEARRVLGTRGYQAQHNQKPSAAEGSMFKRQWFEIVEAAPAEGPRVRAWDKGGTKDGGDPTAGVRMSRSPVGIFYVEDVIKGQWSSFERESVIKQTAHADKAMFPVYSVRLEQEPGSGGKHSAEITVRDLAGFDVKAERSTGEKEVRAKPLAVQAEAGNVKIVRGPWNAAFLDELTSFPGGEHDDQVDAASDALRALALPEKKIQPRVW